MPDGRGDIVSIGVADCRAIFVDSAGDGMSTRIAINPRPYGMHTFDADSGAKQ